MQAIEYVEYYVVGCFHVVCVGGVILLILGSIPDSADPMVVWFFFIFCMSR